jgi:hypothetical protein
MFSLRPVRQRNGDGLGSPGGCKTAEADGLTVLDEIRRFFSGQDWKWQTHIEICPLK